MTNSIIDFIIILFRCGVVLYSIVIDFEDKAVIDDTTIRKVVIIMIII